MVEKNISDISDSLANDEPLEFGPRCLAAIPEDIQDILEDYE
ncbi:hypothetical protein [Fluviispira sanaruensis]|uniref:Uncharacterized protein n=1 Tax=Fluviispira sanaruensis TaxID=2493639 RepID=A0A4P2VM13_FLUSA|nr:hypothetical protein [Fluviispira sanaruensis]BBH52449.1 hypothetical protein JCM31447_317400 [Fluviispira sanaruensis]